jgi:hypothetical protein
VATQVIARPQPLSHPAAVFLKVDAILGGIGREPRSVQYDEFEVCAKFLLRPPGEVAVADTSVNENETLHPGTT